MEETRHPEDWEPIVGYWIVDPDGWRNAGKSWDAHVTLAEFEKLSIGCTISPDPIPSRRGR
jgi:hypothetical protein